VIPGLIAAIVLLVVGKFVAGFVAGLFHKLLKALKFDAVVDKSGLGAHVERAGYPDSGLLLSKLVGWTIMLIFVQMAVGRLGIDSIEDLVNTFVAWIPNVIVAIILVVITGAVANFVHAVLKPSMEGVSAGDLILKFVVAAIWVTGGMVAFRQLGFGAAIVEQLWTAVTTGLAAMLVIKFGVGGIWAARDRFWPKVYDAIER
jgi:hypothetical protein